MHPLTQLRARYGLSQAEVARTMGVTPGAISHLEVGRTRLSTEKWLLLWSEYGAKFAEMGFKLADVMRGESAPTSEAGGA